MKKITIYILALIATAACSLEEVPTSFVNRDSYYDTETQCKTSLWGCYRPLATIYGPNFMLMTEACTDIWYSGSSTVDACLDVTPAKPQFGATVWRQGYMGVMRCNECIECIAKAPLADSLKMPMVAEARVLRAMYYYLLTCVFNGVPYYKQMVADDADLMEIRHLPRTDANEIRTDLYQDLRDNALPWFTEGNGLKVRASEAPEHRAGYALCLMLMAKMAMWNEEWDQALVPLIELENLYGDFTEERYPLEETMWRYKNTPESIFEIQHDWSVTDVHFAGSVAAIMTPSHSRDEATGKFLYDGIEIPYLGDEQTSWSALTSTNNYGCFRPANGSAKQENTGYQNTIFDPLPLTYDDEYNITAGRWYTKIDTAAIRAGVIRGKKIDRRVYYVLGLGDYESSATFNTTRNYGVGWAGPKFWCPGMNLSNDSNNYKVFRYADALLMMAECYCNSGNADGAMEALNKVRERAGVDPITNFTGYESLTAVLRCERARELGGEFQRKFDLVRWGVWYEQTLASTNNAKLRERIKRCHRFYPIPATQCALSQGALSNDEYVAEGM